MPETLPLHQSPIVVIGGPTASGKSAVALSLAEILQKTGQQPVILNADALQLYADLSVLTARPSAGDEARAPHRLYGVLDGATRGTVGLWLDLVRAEISAVLEAGGAPIVVGGSGMYLYALMHGLAIIPEIDASVRREAVALHEKLGGAAFREKLAALDPDGAAKLHEGDPQRLIRAYEVVTGTGRTLESWQQDKHITPPANWRFERFVITPSRPVLYGNCDLRFDLMLKRGAMDEVRQLLTRQLDPQLPVMKAVGVPELAAVMAGSMTLDQAKAKAQQATRNYAKRQLTWFRHQMMDAMRLEHDKPGDEQENYLMASQINQFICR